MKKSKFAMFTALLLSMGAEYGYVNPPDCPANWDQRYQKCMDIPVHCSVEKDKYVCNEYKGCKWSNNNCVVKCESYSDEGNCTRLDNGCSWVNNSCVLSTSSSTSPSSSPSPFPSPSPSLK